LVDGDVKEAQKRGFDFKKFPSGGSGFYKHFDVDINVKFAQRQSDNLSSNDATDLYKFD